MILMGEVKMNLPVVKLTVSLACHPPSTSLQTRQVQQDVLLTSGQILNVLYGGRKFSRMVVFPVFSGPQDKSHPVNLENICAKMCYSSHVQFEFWFNILFKVVSMKLGFTFLKLQYIMLLLWPWSHCRWKQQCQDLVIF